MPTKSKITCYYCGHKDFPKLVKAKERMFGYADVFKIGECVSCQSLHLLDPPKNMDKYYPAEYYAHQTLVKSGKIKNKLKKIRFKLNSLIGLGWFEPEFFNWIKAAKIDAQDKVADIGCGSGQLLYEMSLLGFKNLFGFDPYIEKELSLGPGFQLKKQCIQDISEKFDVVMMHHAFEHMENPKAVLAKAYEILNPGGRLLIRVPVSDAVVWKRDRSYWVQLDSPRHLHIPSTTGLKQLATTVGFQTLKVKFDSTGFQFWGTGLYKQGFPLHGTKKSHYFSQIELLKFRIKARQLNARGDGDQAIFVFQKPVL